MAEAQYYMVYLRAAKGQTLEKIAEKMNHALDWYRIDPTVWILYTTSDAEKWNSRLSPFVKGDGYLFVSRLDISDRQGWMSTDFWKWLRREDEKS